MRLGGSPWPCSWASLLPALALPSGGDGWGDALLETASALIRGVFRITFFKLGSETARSCWSVEELLFPLSISFKTEKWLGMLLDQGICTRSENLETWEL